MIRAALVAVGCMACPITIVSAQQAVTIPIGTPVPSVTLDALSSKTSVKGDMVRLKTSDDIIVEGVVAIPAGTIATGQIADVRAKGAMGMSGRLLIRLLYLSIAGVTVRLSGAASDKASVSAGAVIATVATALPAFTGRSASMPAGTSVSGMVERTASLPRP